jgi:hypothetical protein
MLGIFRKPGQGFEPFSPEGPVTGQPLFYLLEHLWPQSATMDAPVDGPRYEPRLLQHTKMLRYRDPGHIDRFGEFPDDGRAPRQAIKQLPACSVCQGMKNRV